MWVAFVVLASCLACSKPERAIDPEDAGSIVAIYEDATAPGDANEIDAAMQASIQARRRPARVYLIGQSLINHHMPSMLQDIARGFTWDHLYDNDVRNGSTLRLHWEETGPGEGRARDAEDGRERSKRALSPGATRETIGEWGRRFEVPPEDTAARFQEIAWDVVRNDPLSGVH